MTKSKDVGWVCRECGLLAREVHNKVYDKDVPLAHVSTYHAGECDLCHKKRAVTELRDFGYPDTRLVNWASVARARKN